MCPCSMQSQKVWLNGSIVFCSQGKGAEKDENKTPNWRLHYTGITQTILIHFSILA